MSEGSYSDSASAVEYNNALTMSRPSYMFKPQLSIDGNKWCALMGDNLQDGVAGFGNSPEEAYLDFDKNWYEKLPTKELPNG